MLKTVKPRHEVVAVNERNNTGNIKGSLSSNGENKSLPLITAKQYACRAAHLSSLVVSWSPVVSSSDKTSCLLRHWCIIAVGSKSGNLSFWKLPKPEYYTIDAGVVTSDPMLIGVLQAHKSCVSVIAWQVLSAGSSKSSLLLATGCSDGSVKIWLGNIEGLNQCASGEVPFALVAVVATDLSSPVSSISLAIPAQSQHEVSLAIGRVSGSLEIWIWNASSNKIEIFSAWHAHDQVVTGLQWAMDGYCLFSCSQDNSARCWISHENHLEEIFMHSNFPELRESADLSELSDRCYGLTLAPGEQMIAVVRSLDLNLLNQMYQVRTQKAVVEFIWIGGQFVGIPLDRSIDICSSQSTDLSSSNLMWWGSNILWSLKKYENVEKRLVIWDVVAVLQELKKSAPAFLETLVHSWVSVLLSGDPQCVSIDAPSRSMHDMMPYVSTRKLHLLNIMCRKVMVSIHTHHGPGAENGNEETTDFWSTLLVRSETELRERLVGFTFAAVLKRTAYLFNGTSTENCWFPVGVAQMDSWVTMNYDGQVHDQLQSIRSKIKDLGSRCMHFSISIDQSSAIQFHLTGSSFRIDGYSDVESCPYCSSPVHFESPDVAICGERHTLPRCRASMILCSVVQPLWHCVCCGGTVNKLLPESFFTMQASTMHDEGSLDLSAASVPLCPFCGILLQRSMPAFLLSTSPA
ncbi:Transducin/WD40 repeat-like superfamily protein [Zea mays]|uniref:Transducin/WD40 repeat-like superfamily protein n=1 Tax=Zea mays TaxID=4577 RepID=A0A1D6L9P7_MAIZE|nr:Transducin/WD40 repeat-like superfamily protein [Zea mays]